MQKLKIAIIGAGYWGKNLVRVFYSHNKADLKIVCDLDENKLNFIKKFYPSLEVLTDAETIFNNNEINAVIIATPVSGHYLLAKKALLSGKHVLVEKPLTQTSEQAEELVEIAKKNNLILAVDHTFLYTGAVRKLKELTRANELGNLQYFDSERINLGIIQPDVNVLYDLAVHDLSILDFIIDEKPIELLAIGRSFVTKASPNEVIEDAHLHLIYPSGFMAHIHASWLSPVKIRKMLLGGNKKMVLYDDINPTEKIKIYDHGIKIDFESETPEIPIYRSGDIVSPKISLDEALAIEAEEFLEAINSNANLPATGEKGMEIIKILELAEESMKRKGERMKIYL